MLHKLTKVANNKYIIDDSTNAVDTTSMREFIKTIGKMDVYQVNTIMESLDIFGSVNLQDLQIQGTEISGDVIDYMIPEDGKRQASAEKKKCCFKQLFPNMTIKRFTSQE